MWKIIGCVLLATLATAQVDPRCNGVAIVHGFGYVRDLTRCDCWIRCTFDDTQAAVKSERECCGCGMFWNQNVLTCFAARDISCPNDECGRGGITTYAYPGNCRTYFTCDGTKTSGGACCDAGERYDAASQSCVDDATCTDDCLCVDKTTLTPPTCRFRVNPADDRTYLEDDNGVPIVRPCPPGTSFNASACKCSTFVDVPQPACPADFIMTCDADPLTDSANDVYIANTDVDINLASDTCLFNQPDAKLLIQRYANMDWRDSWAVFISFNGGNNENLNAALFSNSACSGAGTGPASIRIKLARFGVANSPVVEVYARINGNDFTVRAPYKVNQRNNIYASYNGKIVKLCVEHEDGSASEGDAEATGLTERVQCSVFYGSDENGNNFNGSIYSTRVYVYCVPRPFCPE